jgi:N-acyl homoserine lactone hydrolase
MPRLEAARKYWDNPDLTYRLVDGDTELLSGIELIESSGHVPGHQSVLVRLPKPGNVLLAIDAIPMTAALDPDSRPILPFDDDADTVRASTRKLVEIADRENAFIICGHDPEQWQTLPVIPQYYS